jgi:hypothetical protein
LYHLSNVMKFRYIISDQGMPVASFWHSSVLVGNICWQYYNIIFQHPVALMSSIYVCVYKSVSGATFIFTSSLCVHWFLF